MLHKPLPAHGQAGCRRWSTGLLHMGHTATTPLDGKHRLAQALLFFPSPRAATEKRKCSPDSPEITFPRNIKKVWSARCGHRRLQRKQLVALPKPPMSLSARKGWTACF